jgi:RNA polymerase sigma-70 factor (family 1)
MHLTNLPGDMIRRLQNSDQRSFDLVYKQFHKAIHFFVKNLIDNANDAEDIAQDTFIKFWERRHDFETHENIKAFLYITARNAGLDYLKLKKGRESDHKILQHISQKEMTIENQIIAADLLRRVYFGVDCLPKKQRQVFKMLYIDKLSFKEIGERLNMNIATVRMHKALAKKHLRSLLGSNSLFFTLFFCIIRLIMTGM